MFAQLRLFDTETSTNLTDELFKGAFEEMQSFTTRSKEEVDSMISDLQKRNVII